MVRLLFQMLVLPACLLLQVSVSRAQSCTPEQVSVNLFQIHHSFDEFGNCLYWKTRSEPNFIEADIPSNHFHLYQDQQAWQDFEYFKFCIDEDNQDKLGALLKDLETEDFLSFHYRNLYYQFGILNSLTYNISRRLTQNHGVWQNGVFYYGTFLENVCLEQEAIDTPRYAGAAKLQYEHQMRVYHKLVGILLRHFEVVERYSFLPVELEDL